MEAIRAYRVSAIDYDSVIVFSVKRSRAKWKCVESLCDFCGYNVVGALRELTICRAPEYDRLSKKFQCDSVIGEEYIMEKM